MRPEAGGTAIVAGEESGPGLGQAQQPQRVAGGRGVEHDMVEALRRRRRAARRRRRRPRSPWCRRRRAARGRWPAPPRCCRRASAPARARDRPRPRSPGRCSSPAGPARRAPRAACRRARPPSISSRLDAGSVLTSSTRLPASARAMATAQAIEVLPTPPLPVKNRKRVGSIQQVHLVSSALRGRARCPARRRCTCVTTPRFSPSRRIECSRRVVSTAPLAPMAWPCAMAPPSTLTTPPKVPARACTRLRSRRRPR